MIHQPQILTDGFSVGMVARGNKIKLIILNNEASNHAPHAACAAG
jgi:hypothetical protein